MQNQPGRNIPLHLEIIRISSIAKQVALEWRARSIPYGRNIRYPQELFQLALDAAPSSASANKILLAIHMYGGKFFHRKSSPKIFAMPMQQLNQCMSTGNLKVMKELQVWVEAGMHSLNSTEFEFFAN